MAPVSLGSKAAMSQYSNSSDSLISNESVHSGDSSNINSTSSGEASRAHSLWGSRINNSLRVFKLQVLTFLFSWDIPTESRKIILQKSRRAAAIHSLLHIIPLSGSLVLLVLNFTKSFIGITFNGAVFLQFVSKLHELLMQASIADIVLYIIKQQAVSAYLPLGALSAVIGASQLSYLWSLDFLSAIRSSSFDRWRKLWFISMIPMVSLLGALVGPSSAVLMIPQWGTLGKTDQIFWASNESLATLFPSEVKDSYKSNTYHWLILPSDPDLQEITLSTGSHTRRELKLTSVTNVPMKHSSYGSWFSSQQSRRNGVATAMVPTILSNNIFLQIREKYQPLNITAIAKIPHPVVSLACTPILDSIRPDQVLPYLTDDVTALEDYFTLQQIFRDVRMNSTTLDHVPPIWRASPEEGSPSIVGVFIGWGPRPSSVEQNVKDNPCSEAPMVSDLIEGINIEASNSCLYGKICTLSGYWFSCPNTISTARSSSIVQIPTWATKEFKLTRLPIRMDAIIDQVNSIIDLPVAKIMASGGETGDRYIRAIAGSVAFFISSISDMFPISAIESGFTLDKPLQTSFEITVRQVGYGYGSGGTSVNLSMVVIMTYCILTVAYLIYIGTTGYTSTAWNSAMEIVVLALRSKRPDHLGFVSGGISSTLTLEEGVGIRINEQDEAELIFAHDRDTDLRKLKFVVANNAY
ncbi:hypothetical protein B0J11DRAFT_505930 [Dendryphion nanum]|uniref:Uncharacterized protein n=1 Tax=Dendryphion nanum TaxID=256645 RepID=A0A9P9DYB1_9PLEO|nr:hypothetical protein B0J11DRAFT_505930 [Dendryphion nanum]